MTGSGPESGGSDNGKKCGPVHALLLHGGDNFQCRSIRSEQTATVRTPGSLREYPGSSSSAPAVGCSTRINAMPEDWLGIGAKGAWPRDRLSKAENIEFSSNTKTKGPAKRRNSHAPVGCAVRAREKGLVQQCAVPIDQRNSPSIRRRGDAGGAPASDVEEHSQRYPDEAKCKDRDIGALDRKSGSRVGKRGKTVLVGTILRGGLAVPRVTMTMLRRCRAAPNLGFDRGAEPCRGHRAAGKCQRENQAHQLHEHQNVQVRPVSLGAQGFQHDGKPE